MRRKGADGLGLLIGIGPAKGSKAGQEYSDEESDEKTLAAEGVMKAIKRGDAAAFSRALEQHYESCAGMKGGADSEMPGEDEDSY